MEQTLPSVQEYRKKVESMQDLTIEQQIILVKTYEISIRGFAANANFLMDITQLNWKRFSAIVNGLVLRGALEKVDKNYYRTKGI
jgi:hypothetical protein